MATIEQIGALFDTKVTTMIDKLETRMGNNEQRTDHAHERLDSQEERIKNIEEHISKSTSSGTFLSRRASTSRTYAVSSCEKTKE